MKSPCAVILAILGASIVLSACGSSGGDTTTVTQGGPPAETSAESPATEKRIERIERETEEAELEAALAKKEAAQQAAQAKKAAAKQAAASADAAQAAQQEEEELSEAPDVIGMRLPEAESTLRAAGFRTQAENTDTAFGIVVKSHYTICTESEPHGDVVTVLAQKYGC
jgi:flagellar biosynthesis GTPase FlhF